MGITIRCLLLCFIWLYSTCGQADSLAIHQDIVSYNIAPHLDYLCGSKDNQYTIDTIKTQRLIPHNKNNVSFKYLKHACWFKFSVKNQIHRDRLLFLSIPFALLDYVDLYEIDKDGTKLYQSGDYINQDKWQIKSHEPLFVLKIKEGIQKEYYLRVKTTSPYSVPIFLYSADIFSIENAHQHIVIGLFFGITIGLLFYNIFLWISTKERRQVYYIGYLLFGLLYFAGLHGFLFQIWPNSPVWNNYSFYAIINLVSLFGFLFVKEYLYDKERNVITKIYDVISFAILCQIIVGFLLPLDILSKSAALSTFCAVVLILISVAFSYKSHKQNAIIILFAWGALFLSAVYTVISNFLGKGNILHTILWLHIGFAVQQILLSIALANYVKTLKQTSVNLEEEARIAKAENVAKSEFLARMSHEIRTPMNAMLGMAQLLETTQLNKDQKQKVKILNQSGRRLLTLIDDILDIARINANKMRLHEDDFILINLFEESIELFTAMAEKKQLQLIYEEISQEIPFYVYGDSMRLQQVINNLLSNAIKFTKAGSVKLSVEVEAYYDETYYLKIMITDTGIGLTEEQQQKLFKNFSQIDTSLSRQYSGSGLGLAISKKIVELMHGKLSVKSVINQGSTFIIEFPLKRAIAQAAPVLATKTNENIQSPTQLNVLVAEDSDLNQMIITAMLERLKMKVHVVNNGQEALDYVMQHHAQIDLVFMDYEMPILDGLQATQKIREWERVSLKSHLPIVALTAHVMPHYEQMGKEAGISKFLTKPIMLGVLQTTIGELFSSDTAPRQVG